MNKENIFMELQEEVNQIKMIDSHSHLVPYADLRGKTDLFSLFALHSGHSLESAGMPSNQFVQLESSVRDDNGKWLLFSHYWERIHNTAYARLFLMAIKKIFGFSDITGDNYQELSEKIFQAYSVADNSYYEKVIKNYAGIEKMVWDFGSLDADKDFFFPAYRFENRRAPAYDHFITVRTRDELEIIEAHYNCSILCFCDFLKVYETAVESAVRKGAVAFKTLLAYLRTLDFELVTKNEAEKVFNTIFTRFKPNRGFLENQMEGPSWKDTKLLQDYMMHYTLRLLTHHKIPAKIHAGFQSGKRNVPAFANPQLLNNLFIHYRDLQFVVMHTAIPFSYELGALAKNFSNVAIDFSWSNTLSPSISKRFLNDMLEFLPVHKIMGFGSDNATAEGVFGEAVMSRKAVTEVLTEKVSEGYFDLYEAKKIANKLLRQNVIDIFKLPL